MVCRHDDTMSALSFHRLFADMIPVSVQRYYRRTSREIKRIASVTLSPIYAHFSESITGLTTIRALRETDRY